MSATGLDRVATAEDIARKCGVPHVPPELRERPGEPAAARRGLLLDDLVEVGDGCAGCLHDAPPSALGLGALSTGPAGMIRPVATMFGRARFRGPRPR